MTDSPAVENTAAPGDPVPPAPAGPPTAEQLRARALADLQKRFTYHAPKADQPERYTAIRSQAHALAALLVEACPDSRERSLALTNLEQAVMWANAAIARNE